MQNVSSPHCGLNGRISTGHPLPRPLPRDRPAGGPFFSEPRYTLLCQLHVAIAEHHESAGVRGAGPSTSGSMVKS
jgi:hypothetical protein